MAKKQFNVMIDPDLKERFKETVGRTVGDMNGALSFATAEALQDYIEKHKHN